jgi:hypothetical protein
VSILAASAIPTHVRWLWRLRAGVAAGVIWIGLSYLSGYSIFGGGPAEPALILAGHASASKLIAGILILSLLGALIACRRDQPDAVRPLAAVALGWALWATGGGTMDQWLIERNPVPGTPNGAVYWALIPDYVVIAVVLVAVRLFSDWLADRSLGSRPVVAFRGLLPLDAAPADRKSGFLALLITVGLASVLISVLMGPTLGKTRQGQVFFAVAVGFWLAVFAARQITKVQRAGWFWPAPVIVGLIGTIVAALRPGFPPPYDQNNINPAWNLVRPLPVEMVSVGLLGILWHFRTRHYDAPTAGVRKDA